MKVNIPPPTALGQLTCLANYPMAGFILTGLGAGTAPGDSVRFEQLPTGVTIVRKTADQTVNNSVVLVNDTHLLHAILANEVWYYELQLWGITSAVANLDFTIVVPAGATGYWLRSQDIATAEGAVPVSTIAFATEQKIDGTGVNRPYLLYAVVINGATPGNVQLQWAQNVAEVSDTQILTNSFLRAWQIL